MARTRWVPALAVVAGLAAAGTARADDTARLGGPAQSGIGGATLSLGGSGTVADARTADDDTELTYYRGGYGYGGYRGGYYGGYRGGYYGGGYRGFYGRPYYGGFYGRPYYGWPYAGGFYGRPWGGYYGYRPGFSLYIGTGYLGGGYWGISGTAADANAPAVPLNAAAPAPTQPAAQPLPAPTPATPAVVDLPVSLKGGVKAAGKPYTFKAYGEK